MSDVRERRLAREVLQAWNHLQAALGNYLNTGQPTIREVRADDEQFTLHLIPSRKAVRIARMTKAYEGPKGPYLTVDLSTDQSPVSLTFIGRPPMN